MAYDDIESIATRMIASYGDDAVRILAERSRRLRKAGQIDDAELWKRVADSAVALLHSRNQVKIVANDTSDGTI